MIVAIDPGVTGAFAYFDHMGQLVAVDDMPTEKVKVGKSMRSRVVPHRVIDLLGSATVVVLELVTPGQSKGSVASFGLGRSFGVVETACWAHDLQPAYVTPRVWKKALGLTADKKQSLALARSLWPERTWFAREKDDGRAEAALIGHWYLDHVFKETPP